MSEVNNALIPFTSEHVDTDSWDSVLFSLGNIGIKLRIEASALPQCLSVFITPLTLESEEWTTHHQHTRELILPVHPQEPLLQFARQPFDHVQWGKKYVKLFWKREVMKVEIRNINNTYHLFFKKMYWDGKDVDPMTQCRKTFATTEKDHDYSMNLSVAMTKDEYVEFEESQQDLDEIRKLIPSPEGDSDGSKRKENVNKILGYLGLQLKEDLTVK